MASLGHLVSLALLAICVGAVAANGWTHPTGRRSGAARLLGLGEAWEVDPLSEAEGREGREGGRPGRPQRDWGQQGRGLAGPADAVLDGGLEGPRTGTAAHGAHGALAASQASAGWAQPPWPQLGQAAQAAQAQHSEQEQQLVNAVGGLGKRHATEALAATGPARPADTARTTAPSPAIFTALGSVGVLSDLSSFFNNLQENLESMENLTPEERSLVFGPAGSPQLLPQAGPGRPMSAPALMTSLRNQRPSFHTRHFVENSEPQALRRSNNHDPQLLWAGLGR